jgi:hypothetical protein
MKVTYKSNNSGGSWWLKDKHWKAMEKAGWFVEWGGMEHCHSEYGHILTGRPSPAICPEDAECPGHRRFDSYKAAKDGKADWLGAMATAASKDFDDPHEAIREFERITGQRASDQGCNCCGAPHSFSWGKGKEFEYVSGGGCLPALFPGRAIPSSVREALEDE